MGNVAVTNPSVLEFRHVPSVGVLSSPNASQCLAAGDTLVVAVQVGSPPPPPPAHTRSEGKLWSLKWWWDEAVLEGLQRPHRQQWQRFPWAACRPAAVFWQARWINDTTIPLSVASARIRGVDVTSSWRPSSVPGNYWLSYVVSALDPLLVGQPPSVQLQLVDPRCVSL
jgi:hypothetical protein